MFLLAWILTVASLSISAQIFEERDYKGERVSCARSGLRGFSESCGSDAGYTYVFIGSVLSVSNLPNNELSVRLATEEIFFGQPEKELVATTTQGRCLEELHPGDRWLFSLQEQEKTRKLLLAYGSSSYPTSEAQNVIERLHRLAQMPQSGLIMGNVSQLVWDITVKAQTSFYPEKYKIIARRKDNGAEYIALTDDRGNYEFEPLPPGSYEMTANTDPRWWGWEGTTEVRPGTCSKIGFELSSNGSISGRVRNIGGDPDKSLWVTAVAAGEEVSESHSTFANKDGHFEFHGLRPGRYLIGVGIDAEPETAEWKQRVYYPGVRLKELAIIIEIARGQQRSNIDFSLPAH